MKLFKVITALGLGLAVTACGTVPDIASRNAAQGAASSLAIPAPMPVDGPQQVQQLSLRVTHVGVNVPRTLKANESNSYYPLGDIVWRGDPIGDRHAQVKAIFEAAIAKGTDDMKGKTPAIVDIQVIRFHSITDRTRNSVGGVHNMIFRMRVRDAGTGQVLMPTRVIEADLPAFGGAQAVHADMRGQTQKVRVTDYLAYRIRKELMTLAVTTDTPALSQLKRIKN